ncbi:MAG: hypothetical protein QXS23_02425 [Desulfurococcaceae archaeon]
MFKTGFLTPEEVKGIFRPLSIEITYADVNDRVRFRTNSNLVKGLSGQRQYLEEGWLHVIHLGLRTT